MFIVADVAIGPTILLGGVLAGLVLLIPIVLLETLVLWRMKWGSFRQSLLDSALANVVSTLFGVVFFAAYYATTYHCELQESADKLQSVSTCDFTISPLLWLAVTAVLSIVIEGFILQWRKSYAPRITWDAAIGANLLSYALLGALLFWGLLQF